MHTKITNIDLTTWGKREVRRRRRRRGENEVCQRCCLPFLRMLLIILAAAWRGYMYAKRLSHKSGRNLPPPRQRLHCAKNNQETFAYLTSLSIVVKLEFLNILQANWHKKSCKVVKFGLTLRKPKEFQSVPYLYLSKRRLKTIEGFFKVMLITLIIC